MVVNRDKLEERLERLISDPNSRKAPKMRQHPRHPTHHACTVFSAGSEFKAILKNLSADGAMVYGTGIHNITTETARLTSYICGNVRVRIVWSDTDCIGIEFL
jgi:PilZ domain